MRIRLPSLLYREQCFYCTKNCTAPHLKQQPTLLNPCERTMAKTGTTDTLAIAQRHAPGATISAFLGLLILWCWRVRCWRELSTLSARQMRDAGLDPEIVRGEGKKPFWKA